jgi:hypothetical protein
MTVLAFLTCSVGLLISPPALRPAALLQHTGAARCPAVRLALDYKDPMVAEEFTKCQALDTEAVEDELAASGIPVPPTMNDMDMRMMLVEMRLRKTGKIGNQPSKPKKAPAGANPFEVALCEKPGFRALYEGWQQTRNTNAMNLATEHLVNPRRAKERYGGTAKYDETIAQIDEALNARIVQEVTSGRVTYSGFPANMGEAGVKMTLGAFGELKEFTFEANDDGLTCSGKVEFEDADVAKAAIDKYDGMDMGLGTTLELVPQ